MKTHSLTFFLSLTTSSQATPTHFLGKVIILPFLKPNSDPTLPASYRPIALSSVLGKLFQKILNKRLLRFLESNNILSPSNTVSEKAVASLNLLSIYKTKLINPHSQNPVFIPSSSTSKKPNPGSEDITSATNFSMPVYEATYLQYTKVFSTIEP